MRIEKVSTQSSAGDTVTVSILKPEMDTIWDEARATARLQADPNLDLIYKVVVGIPKELQAGRTAAAAPTRFTDFGDRTRKDIPIELPQMSGSRWSPAALFYTSRTINVPVQIAYAIRDDEVRELENLDFPVTPRAPLAGVILGGIVGVMAVLLILFLYKLARERSRKVFNREYRNQVLARLALGIAVSTFVICILRVVPSVFENLPVTADVKDWTGGLIIGMSFQKVAQWIADKLDPREPPAPRTQRR